MTPIPSNLFYAYLCAPEKLQRWEAVQEIKTHLNGKTHLLALQVFRYERSHGIACLETGLRKFWTRVALGLHSL